VPGGLDLQNSEAHSVLIYREEKRELLQDIGARIEQNEFRDREDIPTVYRVNLKDPRGLFVAQNMQLRHGDMVYVDNHPIAGLSRILTIVRDILLIRLIND
jgi:polysaccharide export outer membrane protein